MRKLGLSLLILLVCAAQAHAESPSLVDYLRKAPATVSGQIQFDDKHSIYKKGFVSSGIRKDKSIGFDFDEHHVQLNSKNAIYVSVAGVPVNITKLNYDNRTGQIAVRSDIMGTGINAPMIEKKVRAEVQRLFQPKLKTAFEHLSKLRQQRTLGDASSVLHEIARAFQNNGPKKGMGLPSYRGDLTLTVSPVAKDQTVTIGKLDADLKKGDALYSTIYFRKPKSAKLQLSGLSFTSAHGIRVRHDETSKKTVKAVILKGFSASEQDGFQIQGTNVGDDVINTFQLLTGIIKLADSGNPTALNDCQPTDVVQDSINTKARGKVLEYVKRYRTDFLEAGATPALILAIENSREA